MSVTIKVLGTGDEGVLASVAPGVFDHEVLPNLTRAFLEDRRHHLVVAVDNGRVIGFVSAVDSLHPDKEPELWINEVGVAPTHRGQGLAKRLLQAMFDLGREIGCREAWVLTERSHTAAMRLYGSLGGTDAPQDQVMFTYRLQPPARDNAPG